MNLFFRFLRVFLTALLSRTRTDLMEVHTICSSVWLGDQDPMGHMTNSRYSSFTDLAIMNYMGRTGTLAAFRKRGWLPVIQHEAFSYFRMLRFPQKFTVETRLLGWHETHMIFRHTFIADGRLHAESTMIARLTGRKKMRVTAEMAMEALGVQLESPPLTPQIMAILEDLKARS